MTIEATDGSIVYARGIDICNNPIGEELYVQTFLANKLDSICKEIKRSSDYLSDASRHANFLAFYHSYQARFDYWTATNNLVYTGPLAIKLDAFLRDILISSKHPPRVPPFLALLKNESFLRQNIRV